MRDFVKMISVLFITCGLAAGSLALVNMVTRERIALWDKQRKEAALKAIFAGADEFKEVNPGATWEVWSAGEKKGTAFLIQQQGYSGPISLMFAVDGAGAVTGLEVLGHTETPGLGAKIITTVFRDQFKGKTATQLQLKKDSPQDGRVDAITGATISSRAVTRALRETLETLQGAQNGETR